MNDKTIWYSRPTNCTFIMKRVLFKIPFAKFTVKIHVYTLLESIPRIGHVYEH